jgi:transglutaminase-like putative cysteine protease
MSDASSPETSDFLGDNKRIVSCDLTYEVLEPSELVIQIVAAASAGEAVAERFSATGDGSSSPSVQELRTSNGERIHVIRSEPGPLSVSYRSEILASPPRSSPSSEDTLKYETLTYRRPRRYVPSDHLVGFAVAEFEIGTDVAARTAAIAKWIWNRISYVYGSSDVHDSAEHTLLTGMGTCRDFAHLDIALCRATGIPARFASVYAPGLSPMDFHAVFEAFRDGRWFVYDATGLAPRSSLVRIATGRDAADTAFSAINYGVVIPQSLTVTATVGSILPLDDLVVAMELP